jgi:hypothetical protein
MPVIPKKMTQTDAGFLILDRKGEYIRDTIDQRSNRVFGLHRHRQARQRMVVVSGRDEFARMKERGSIRDHLLPRFNIQDIDPIDLADFLPGLTPTQADLVRDYAHLDGFYRKLLAETQFGAVDNRNWFRAFPGLFDLKEKGKKLIKEFEERALAEGREELTDEELTQLHELSGGTKPEVLARVAQRVKRFCLNRFFGGSAKGRAILETPSCVQEILGHLAAGRFVFIDMLGQPDEDYTLVAALFARRLLTENKDRDDERHIRACMVMEEAHNILSEDELYKGNGRGSVFVELAREGRSFKLGFLLVTQQPDARSIAPEVVKTIDTVVAFNMQPDDAKHLQRLKSAFAGLEVEISNAREFQGVAVSQGGPVFFESEPIDGAYMKACVDGSLEERVGARAAGGDEPREEPPPPPSVEDRLAQLMRQRQESVQKIALETMRAWRAGAPGDDGEAETPRPVPRKG